MTRRQVKHFAVAFPSIIFSSNHHHHTTNPTPTPIHSQCQLQPTRRSNTQCQLKSICFPVLQALSILSGCGATTRIERNINRRMRRRRRSGEVVEAVVCLRPFVTVSLCSNATSSMQIENLLFSTQVSTKSSIHCHQVGCCHSGKGTHLSPPCRPNRHAKTVVVLVFFVGRSAVAASGCKGMREERWREHVNSNWMSLYYSFIQPTSQQKEKEEGPQQKDDPLLPQLPSKVVLFKERGRRQGIAFKFLVSSHSERGEHNS